MKKELKFITCCPSDTYFTWQVHSWLEALKNLNYSKDAFVLIFNPLGRIKNNKWQQIVDLYPEATFKFYDDDGTVAPLLGFYIPILRPYLMIKFHQEYPEMKNNALFYFDSDVLLNKRFNVDHLLDDEIIYLSDTNSYINASYFDSKIRDVLPEKLEEYKKRDILEETASIVGINRQVCEKNNLHSGGTQYLLKNVDEFFWKKVLEDCLPIRTHLQNVNKEFFKNTNTGFQDWVTDMWSVLWNLWLREQETKVVPELAFSWSTDELKRIDETTIFHNAGVASTIMNNIPYFYKGKYHTGQDPFKDTQIDIVLNHEESKKYCTWWYANELKKLQEKYKLNY